MLKDRPKSLSDVIRQVLDKPPAKKPGPREPTGTERAAWFERGSQKPPKGIDKIASELDERHHLRMRKIRSDYKWLQKQVQKRGGLPDDARWLL